MNKPLAKNLEEIHHCRPTCANCPSTSLRNKKSDHRPSPGKQTSNKDEHARRHSEILNSLDLR